MLKVSVILAVAILTGLALTDIDEELKALDKKLVNSLEKCRTSTSLTDEDLNKIYETETVSTKAGCFIACFAKEFDTIKADNKFDKEKIYKVLEPLAALAKRENQVPFANNVTTIINKCLESQTGGVDPCDAGKKGGQCLLTEAKKIGMF